MKPGYLKPFFTYFGGKWKSAPYYPEPKFDTIIEPFAGACGYSLNYYDLNIVLRDANPDIVDTWRFLIQSSPDDIWNLPDILQGQNVDELDIPSGAKSLIGFWCGRGRATPGKTLGGWGKEKRYSKYYWGPEVKERIASQVDHIKHWVIEEGCYSDFDTNLLGTWFVDPPYRFLGRYPNNHIDYKFLGDWVTTLNGQVIVCEGEYGNWLDFHPLVETLGNNGRLSVEKIWTKGC